MKNWLDEKLEELQNSGIVRPFTEQELNVALQPMVKEILNAQDRLVVEMLLERSIS